MPNSINRRQWLKASAAAAVGLAVTRNTFASNFSEAHLRPRNGDSQLIWLDQNENPYGISKKAKKAINEAVIYSNRYPDELRKELIKTIARHENVKPNNIILGAGSSEVLYTAGYLYGAKTGEVLMADPGYHGFTNYISRVNSNIIRVPLNDRYVHDLDAMYRRITRRTRLVCVCNPNNPTGTIVDSKKLRSFCEQVSRRSMVIVDEAYHEFVEDSSYSSMIDFVRSESDVIILRTFSKVFGLAGLRVGYGIAKRDIIVGMRRLQGNYNPVAVLSLAAAKASYEDSEYIEYSKNGNIESRSYFYQVLDELGYFYIPSHTNFVIFRIASDSVKFAAKIREHNVVVRPFKFDDSNWIRVSMGTLDQMKTLANVLEKLT